MSLIFQETIIEISSGYYFDRDNIYYFAISDLYIKFILSLIMCLGIFAAGQNLREKFKFRMSFFKLLLLSIFLGIIVRNFSYLITYIDFHFFPEWFTENKEWDFERFMTTPFNTVIIAMVVLLPSAFFEEIQMRGFYYDVIKEYSNMYVAILINSIIFTALHYPYPEFYPNFFLGNILLCLIYERWRSIPLLGIIHFTFNLYNDIPLPWNQI